MSEPPPYGNPGAFRRQGPPHGAYPPGGSGHPPQGGPAPYPSGPPPIASPRRNRRLLLGLLGGAVVLVGVLVAGLIVVVQKVTADPGDAIPQPHRAAAHGPRPASGEPRWAAPDHHWIALSESWSADRETAPDKPRSRGLVSDGERAIELLDTYGKAGNGAPAELTAYDGATGEALWHRSLPWTRAANPVAGNGVVIVPGGPDHARPDATPVDYVALDSATGAQRWRVHADAVAIGVHTITQRGGRPQPCGVLLDGVFYYTDGRDIVGVDATTGAPRHRFTNRSSTTVGGPVAVNGGLAVLAHTEGAGPGSYAVHLFPRNLRRYTAIRLPGDGLMGPERLAASGDVLAVWGKAALWTVDTRTGRRLVRVRLPVLEGDHDVLGRTFISVNQTTHGRTVIGRDLLTGRRTWSVKPFPAGSVNVETVDGTVLAIGSGVAIIDPAAGKTAFTRKASGDAGAGHAVRAGGHIVVDYSYGIAGYR